MTNVIFLRVCEQNYYEASTAGRKVDASASLWYVQMHARVTANLNDLPCTT
jgi:hypothetical protein